jgi:hypothetical protein
MEPNRHASAGRPYASAGAKPIAIVPIVNF